MAFGIEGERIRLVPLEAAKHLDNCYRWLNDPDVTTNIGIGHFPISLVQETEIFDRLQKPDEKNIVWAIETLEGRHIGQSGLHEISLLHGTGVTGSFLGSVDDRGKGYGTEAAALRSHYAFHVLGLRMLYSVFQKGNIGSQRMQEKSGYQVWGTQPAAGWNSGGFRDVVHTYLSREMWLDHTNSK